MNKHTKLRIFGILFLPALVALLSLVTSCESSRTAPEVPIYTPVEPAQPLILSGYVKDADNNSAVASAIVTISKLDGSLVVTQLSDNSGKYTYDLATVDASQLKVSATKASYGFASALATVDKSANSASINSLFLKKLAGVSATATATAGGTTSAPSTESKSTTQAAVQVPPGAVNQNTTITVAPIPVGAAPSKPAGQAPSVSVLSLEPSGITFNVPVTVIFPLPVKLTAGKTMQLKVYNNNTGQWDNSGFSATVASDGLSASGSVTHFSTWELEGEVTTNTTSDVTANVGNAVVTDAPSGNLLAYTYVPSFTFTAGEFTEAYMKGVLSNIFGFSLGNNAVNVSVPKPAPPANKVTTNANNQTVHYNPAAAKPYDGYWVWKPIVQPKTRTITVRFSNGINTQDATVILRDWVKTGDDWSTWVITHNQGG